jgi:uroporphyrinogen-III synthase
MLRGIDDPAAARAAKAALRDSDIAIFISPAAVKYAFATKLRLPRGVRVCAIGATTAAALGRHGVRGVVFPRTRQDSEGLLAEPDLNKLRGKRVALVGAPGGRELLMQTLRERRARVTKVDVYRRDPARYTNRQLATLEDATAPLLTLVSSADVLAHLRATLPLHAFAKLAGGELIVSSLRLAELARNALFANVHIATSPAPHDLLETAQQVLARHRL